MELFALATSITPDRTPTFTATVVIAGLGIVLVTLAVLIVVFKLFGNIVSKSQNKSKKKAVEAQQKEMQQVSTAPAAKTAVPVAKPAQQGISGEVVAAISAAVYAIEGEGAVIRSITPKKQSPIGVRNPWAQAAVIDNTRPF